MDQVTQLVNTLKEKTAGKVLPPETVVNVLKKKLDPSVIRNVGGDAGLLARVKLLLSPPPAASSNKNNASSSNNKGGSSSDDDDSYDDSDDDSDDDDDDDSGDDEEDFDDEEGDEESDDDSFEFDDESTDAASSKASSSRRRQRDGDTGGAAPTNDAAQQQQSPEQKVEEILKFLKKCSLQSEVSRKRNNDAGESAQDYIDNVLKPLFAKKELNMDDLSKDAVRRWKVRKELDQLKAEGADLSLERGERRGKPIFNDQGKVIGIVGGKMIQDAGTVSKGLCDEE